jgi:hypothetical protein
MLKEKIAFFLLGSFAGSFTAFFSNVFLGKIKYFVNALLPILCGILNVKAKVNISVVFPVFNILFCVAYVFLLVRFQMAIMRSVIASVPYDSNTHKKVIVSVTFVSLSLVGYLVYTHLPNIEWTMLSWVWCVSQVANLILTLWTDEGNIGDYSSLLLASTASLVYTTWNDAPYESITVIRTLFVAITLGSPLVPLPNVSGEEFSFFALKKKRIRITLVLMVVLYFVNSPVSMWAPGDEPCNLIALLIPGMYALMLTVEASGVIKRKIWED